eukprot:TRINITY_DN12433_c0_g1_i2.p1 TRINITY_DN12433_c0_g1~~TRINITY_DN12433_c0_g1_i2.p1  ORF type:complete len:334 (+),score=76.79 TRINITY_DN12433_c0_g1_i2:80-1003(+)
MFARADRTLLNDANRSRFSHAPPAFCNEPLSPGPTAYHPPPGRKPGRSTRRFIFPKGDRKPLNHAEVRKDVPGPGAYEPHPPTAFRPAAFTPRQHAAERRREEVDALSSAGVSCPDVPVAQHNSLFSVSRVPRLLNMIDGVNHPHTLREYSEQRTARPGPADYELPPLWHGACTARAGSHRSGASPRAVVPRTGRRPDENLDLNKFDPDAPGPLSYAAQDPPPRPKLGTLRRAPRDLQRSDETFTPGPGSYATPPHSPGRLRMQIPQAPRQLGHVVCGVDLKRCRKLPGPSSYHPIHDDIVRQPYTV